MDGDGAVEEPALVAQGRAHKQQRAQLGAGGHHMGEGGERGVEQRILLEEIVVGVGREPKLGEER